MLTAGNQQVLSELGASVKYGENNSYKFGKM
jgi:hypothetical protein